MTTFKVGANGILEIEINSFMIGIKLQPNEIKVRKDLQTYLKIQNLNGQNPFSITSCGKNAFTIIGIDMKQALKFLKSKKYIGNDLFNKMARFLNENKMDFDFFNNDSCSKKPPTSPKKTLTNKY
ncbi:MAG: hypothetical protein PVG30_03085 [Gammaproteobacteria bacterium]|jgi:hypothetical protein